MRNEYDFSDGMRGKFFLSEAKTRLPVYLDEDVVAALTSLANARGLELPVFVNQLLRHDIAAMEQSRQV